VAEAQKRAIDWEAIELAYRSGVLSTREIGAQHDVSHTLINRKAKAEKWDRDLSAKIKAKADAIVSKAGVSSEVSMETEQQTIAANANLVAGIQLSQRKDIQRSRNLVMSLLGELEHQTEHRELYEQLGELMFDPDEKGVDKLNEIYRKAMSLQGRTGTMKSLSDSLKTLVALEREAFGIDGGKEDEGAGKTAKVDLNVTVSPEEAYLRMVKCK
jgi:hypothetical protein